MARRTHTDDNIEEIGHIGDVNWAEHGGGPVYCRRPEEGGQATTHGDCFLEYVEPPTDDIEFSDPNARWTVYSVELEPEVPSWGDIEHVAQAMDEDPKELAAAFVSPDPMQRAGAYESWARYYGWHEFDEYRRELTCAEMNEQYDADLDCYGEIQTKLEEAVQQMVDESAAQAWSQVDDQTMIDLDNQDYEGQSAFAVAAFGQEPAIAVNTELTLAPSWAKELGIKTDANVLIWSEIGTRELESWLEKNGYEITDRGGDVPNTEGYAYSEHVIRRVAREMGLPEETVYDAAEALDWWQEEIPGSTDGDATIWAKRAKEENNLDETRRKSVQNGCPPGSRSYMARYVHQISPKPTDVGGPFCIRDSAWSDRKTLGAALRKAGVLDSGARVRDFRVEGERVIVFPSMPGMTTYWHSVILTPND